jgi:hypothetical protein
MKELAITIRGARWRMLGHTLGMADDVPAKKATNHYFDPIADSFLGRPRITLPIVLDKDLKLASAQKLEHLVHKFNLPRQLKTKNDLKHLETLANDRQQWMRIVVCVTDM